MMMFVMAGLFHKCPLLVIVKINASHFYDITLCNTATPQTEVPDVIIEVNQHLSDSLNTKGQFVAELLYWIVCLMQL